MTTSKKTQQVTVACAVVIRRNKVLMTLRYEPELPTAHLKWEFPGGKVDFGETPEDAVKREVVEETGVKVEVIKLLPYTQTSYWEYSWGTKQSICFVYLCKFISEGKEPHDHRIEKIDWIEIEKIKTLDSLPGTNEIIDIVKEVL